MSLSARISVLLAAFVAGLHACANAQETSPVEIAATIDGQPVLAAEAELEFQRAFGEQQFDDAQRREALRRALDQVIDRRLVLAYLARTSQAASEQDIDFALAQFEKDLAAQSITLDEHLKTVGLSLDEVRHSLAWKLSWGKYLERHLTDENLQKYFERHKTQFDGTELRVAHILFTRPATASDAEIEALRAQAAAIGKEIESGKLSFADAAKEHSQAPTSKAGGDIGWIERHQPMPESFSRAAYALQVGEVSEPVVSSFGIHLITILETKPGQKVWSDLRPELRSAVTIYLFRWIADRERAKAKIEYTEAAKGCN
jgi:peptidyl-prolyl cis-trans isomerase C